ncbi:MAG: recombinase RecT [Gemmatimonadota bacterium]
MSTALTPAGNSNKALTPIDKLKSVLSAESVKQQFENALGDAAPLFVASIIDAYAGSKQLQLCAPALVIAEALKAATLRLPINRNLGFAYIVPRKEKGVPTPQMQIGWKGYVQLGQRSGQYRYINAGPVFEGETVHKDRLSGAVTITGKEAGPVKGFFAYFKLLNGFEKADYWSTAEVEAHRNQYVPGWDRAGSAWQTSPRAMAMKTVLSNLLRKYGVLSIEMQRAISEELGEWEDADIPATAPTRTGSEALNAAVGIAPDPDPEPEPEVTDAEFDPVMPDGEPDSEPEPPKRTRKNDSPQADLV